MNVTYSEKVKRSPDDLARLKEATARLEKVIGPSARMAKAEWDRAEDEKARPVYTLRMSDQEDSASAELGQDVMADPSQLDYRLLWAWGDLLQARNQRQLRTLQAMDASEI